MPATVHVQLQLWIVGDDGTELTDYEILRLKRSGKRLEALGLSLSKARLARQHCRRSGTERRLANDAAERGQKIWHRRSAMTGSRKVHWSWAPSSKTGKSLI
jgi:hypothetical protein